LRKAGADNIAGQIFKAFVVVGPDVGTAIDIKAAMAPGEHIFKDCGVEFCPLT
jgi:hypothetical protein